MIFWVFDVGWCILEVFIVFCECEVGFLKMNGVIVFEVMYKVIVWGF